MASRTIRFKLYTLLSLPIAALVALWTFATGHVVGDYLRLRQACTLYERVASPATALVIAVQRERKLSAVALSSSIDQAARLAEVRDRTDRAVTAFRRDTSSAEATAATGPETRAAIAQVVTEAGRLGGLRGLVDARTSDRLQITQSFNRLADAAYRLQDRLVAASEVDLYRQEAGLQWIAYARDLMSREDALISGAAFTGVLARPEYEVIETIAPSRRLLLAEGISALDDELRGPFEALLASAAHRKLATLEQEIVQTAQPPQERRAWSLAASQVGGDLDRLLVTRARQLNERAATAAGGIVTRIAVTGGLGLFAIAGTVFLSVRLGRGLTGELGTLRLAALELAGTRLPKLVERLRGGEAVDVEAEMPPIPPKGTTQEIIDVGRAFSTVHRTALEAAVGEARLRAGFNRVFRNLARRNQSLVHRQLSRIDAMRGKTTEPEALEDLSRLGYLTSRMRRESEGLIILSGATAGRTRYAPASFLDVLRAAVAEVEDSRRITVHSMPDTRLTGTATLDLTHLLAELMENATVFSPPETSVSVRGGFVARGFVVEIEDRGLGLGDEEREAINERLADPPEFDMADSERLGLFVVSRLAARHGIQITLNRSPFGGTTAVVLIPRTVIVPHEGAGAVHAAPSDQRS